MTLAEYNRYCASLPAATHVVQWGGAHVWKVGGKVFAIGPEIDLGMKVTWLGEDLKLLGELAGDSPQSGTVPVREAFAAAERPAIIVGAGALAAASVAATAAETAAAVSAACAAACGDGAAGARDGSAPRSWKRDCAAAFFLRHA